MDLDFTFDLIPLPFPVDISILALIDCSVSLDHQWSLRSMFLMWQPSPRVTLMYVCNESFKYYFRM